MYSNAGKSIKQYVEILVKIGYGIEAVGGVVIVILGIASENFGTFLLSLLIAAVVVALGCLLVWLAGLWLYAYGEITDRLISIDEKMGNNDAVAPVSTTAPVRPVTPPAPVYPAPSGSGWTCSCGRKNANYVSTCSCGINKRDLSK